MTIDISTLVTSVATTFAIQGAYYVFMQFPDRLRRNMINMERTEIQFSTEYRLYKNANHEARAALQIYQDWKSHLIGQKETLDSDREHHYFHKVLPQLTDSLGRLRGVFSTYDSSGINDFLADYGLLLEQARRITKLFISDVVVTKADLASELSDMGLIESKVDARWEQIEIEFQLRQSALRSDIETVDTDRSDIFRRYLTAALALMTLSAIAALLFGYFLAPRLTSKYGCQVVIENLFPVGVLLIVALSIRKVADSALREVAHLKASVEKQSEARRAAYDKYLNDGPTTGGNG